MALASHVKYASEHYAYRAKDCLCSLCFRMVVIYIISLSSFSCCEKLSWHQDPRQKQQDALTSDTDRAKRFLSYPMLSGQWFKWTAAPIKCKWPTMHHNICLFHQLCISCPYSFLNASLPNRLGLFIGSNCCSIGHFTPKICLLWPAFKTPDGALGLLPVVDSS